MTPAPFDHPRTRRVSDLTRIGELLPDFMERLAAKDRGAASTAGAASTVGAKDEERPLALTPASEGG